MSGGVAPGPGALAGMRVLDLTHVRVGPLAARTAAFFGAQVIKVERVDEYDWARLRGLAESPRRAKTEVAPGSPNLSSTFNNLNADKLAITLNTRHPDGLALLERLIAISDAVIENFSAGVMDSWGLGFERMKELNPRIAYVSMSGFGHSGPLKEYRTYGPTVQALSGLTITSGRPGEPPAGWGFSYMDVEGGFIGGLALLTAIYHVRRTGEACYVDDAIMEGAMMLLGPFFLDYEANGRSTRRSGFPPGNRSLYPPVAPHNTYRCSGTDRIGQDQWCFIACETDEQFAALRGVIGDGRLDDVRFATSDDRVRHQEDLDAIVGEWTAPRSRYEVMERCQGAGVIAAAVQDSEDRVEHDPQLRHRGVYPLADHPELGTYKFEGYPPKLSRTPATLRRGGPLWGEHNRYVYGELLGLPDDEIDRLTAEGVI